MAATNHNLVPRCQGLYSTLLTFQAAAMSGKIPATVYIREVFETERCDNVLDMSLARAEYEERLGGELRVMSLMNFDPFTPDEYEIAAAAVKELTPKHRAALISALPLHSRVYHHMVQPLENAITRLSCYLANKQ